MLLLAVGKVVHIRVDELVQIHRCTQLVTFWCTRPSCPGLPPFCRAGGSSTTFLKRGEGKHVIGVCVCVLSFCIALVQEYCTVSLAVAGFKRAWELPDPLREEFSPKPPCKQEAGLS